MSPNRRVAKNVRRAPANRKKKTAEAPSRVRNVIVTFLVIILGGLGVWQCFDKKDHAPVDPIDMAAVQRVDYAAWLREFLAGKTG